MEIQQIILKRLRKYPDYFDAEALYEISRFSDGNPKDALWIAQQIVLDNFEKTKIDGKAARKSIKKVACEYFSNFLEIFICRKRFFCTQSKILVQGTQ